MIPYPKREFLTDDDQDEKADTKRQAQTQQQQAQQQSQQQQQQQQPQASNNSDSHGNQAKRPRLGPHQGQVNPQVRLLWSYFQDLIVCVAGCAY